MSSSHDYLDTNTRYSHTLATALDHFTHLISTPDSTSWKPIPNSLSSATSPPPTTFSTSTTLHPPISSQSTSHSNSHPTPDTLTNGLATLNPAHLKLHLKKDKHRACDIVRVVAEVNLDDSSADSVIERARAVLATAEVRPTWDKLVDRQTTLELLDPQTRVVKTDYRLGWPASPRDTITISRTFLTPPSSSSSSSSSSSNSSCYSPGHTLIDLSTSLPRPTNTSDEPAFLRPSPPFVRANLHLGAWALQVLPPSVPPPLLSQPATSHASNISGSGNSARLRITLFHQLSLRLLPASSPSSPSSSTTQARHAAELVQAFLSYLRSEGEGVQLPLLRGYGRGVELNRDEWDREGEMRSFEYAVVAVPGSGACTAFTDTGGKESRTSRGKTEEEGEEGQGDAGVGGNLQGLDELARRRERKRLERSLEVSLPALGVVFPSGSSSVGGEGREGNGESHAGGGARGGGGNGTGDGWDVRLKLTPLPGPPAAVPIGYSLTLSAPSSSLPSSPSSSSASLHHPSGRLTLRITHDPLLNPAHLVRVSLTAQRLAGGKSVWVNGEKVEVERVEVRDSTMVRGSSFLSLSASAGARGGGGDDAASLMTHSSSSSARSALPPSSSAEPSSAGLESGISLRSTKTSASTSTPSNTLLQQQQQLQQDQQQQLTSLLRRLYIYFLSLLQEPPPKWRPLTDSQGVTVTQLLSPDPTLTIYRAEAVVAGVGVWDVFGAVVSQGTRRVWDKGIGDVRLLVGGGEGEGGAGGEGGEAGKGGGGGIGLSEIWWEKRPGRWPVAARDSLLLRTTYKSPSSIHIFSSSPPAPASSSPALFPSLPPPAPGTIRTQTDLQAWSIESLSPTTTLITLLEQSDPKGWSSKAGYTPSAMVQAVAGVRDYTIRFGSPPTVTRLSGGRKVREEFEHEKGQLRVEYVALPESSFSSTSSNATTTTTTTIPAVASPDLFLSTSPAGAITLPSPPPVVSAPSQTTTQEDRLDLEIRCDPSTHSTTPSTSSSSSSTDRDRSHGQGLEVVIDPPPLSVSCLARHRLTEGGGLWITVEHTRNSVVKEGKVVVTVRRASSSSSSASSSAAAAAGGGGGGGGGGSGGLPNVTVNGARIKVDVEVLEDEKIRELEKRKRERRKPVPLDQWEEFGGKNGHAAVVAAAAIGGSGLVTPAASGTTAPGVTATVAQAAETQAEATTLGKDGQKSVTDDPLAGVHLAAPSEALAAAAVAAGPPTLLPAPSTFDDISPPSTTSTKPPLEPAASALEALSHLQTFHAGQGPELTDPAPGWAIVSERGGTVVRKKLVPSISPDLPVYRGDKIVQGLTADELRSIITAPSLRKLWDDKVESATRLESFGNNGISTEVVITKPSFPWKGRAFYVANVGASVKVPSAAAGASTSTVLFVASASFDAFASSSPSPSPSSAEGAGNESSPAPSPRFDPIKTNPLSLPLGTTYLSGWILETLDPYTSSVLAIPSTRCTYVSCTDFALPNLSLGFGAGAGGGGAGIAKTIQMVEQLGKVRGALPRLVWPIGGLAIEGNLGREEEGEGEVVWKLGGGEGGGGQGAEGRSEVVTVDFEPKPTVEEGGVYRALFKVGGAGDVGERASRGRESTAGSSATVTGLEAGSASLSVPGVSGLKKRPSLSHLSPSLPVGSTLLRSEVPRSVSLNFSTAAPPILDRTPGLAHKTSRQSLRSRSPSKGSSAATSPANSSATVTPSVSSVSLAGSGNGGSRSNGSSTTFTDPGEHDLVVAELVVDLKQYPHGYSISASSSLVPASSSSAPAGFAEPLSLDPFPPRAASPPTSTSRTSSPSLPATQIALRCTAHDAPLPSILTASLDAWKRANHLVRILVPTGAIIHPILDPLRPEETQDEAERKKKQPEWYRLLTEGEGALVEVKVTPLPPPAPRASAAKRKEQDLASGTAAAMFGKVTGQAARTAVFNGEKVVVASMKESRRVSAKLEDEDAEIGGRRISRVAPRKRRQSSSPPSPAEPATSSSLPEELRHPLAVATRLLAPKPVAAALDDDFEFPDPKSPGSVTPADATARSPVLGGKGVLKPALSRRNTSSSITDAPSSGHAGPLLNILNSYPLSRLGSSVINATAPVMTADSSSSLGGAVAVRRTYTLSFVLLVAICAFLLGSLLRSLLTPADYIIYRPDSAAQQGGVEQALLQAFDPNRRWREARRLIELRSAWSGVFSWDIILCAVKRE